METKTTRKLCDRCGREGEYTTVFHDRECSFCAKLTGKGFRYLAPGRGVVMCRECRDFFVSTLR